MRNQVLAANSFRILPRYGLDNTLSEAGEIAELKHRLDEAAATIAGLRAQTNRHSKAEYETLEKALADSEERYHNLIRNSGLGVHLAKIGGGRLFINDALVQLLGYDSAEEIIDRPAYRLIAEEDQAEVKRRRLEAEQFPPGHSESYECRFIRKDGSIIPLQVTISKIRWENDYAIHRVVVDMSEQKSAEQARRTVENRFRALVENFGLGVHITRIGGGRLFTNRTMMKLLGYDSDEELQEVPVYQIVAPYDREKAARYRDQVVASPDQTVQYDCDFVRKNGTLLPVHVVLSRITWEGEDAIQRTVVDLSERRRAEQANLETEERLRAIIDHSPSLIYLKDTESNLLLVNKAFEKVSGLQPGKLGARNARDWLGPETAERLRSQDQKVIATGKALETEYNYTHPDGSVAAMQSIKFPVKDGSGDIVGVGGIGTDITMQKRAVATLEQAKHEAETAATMAMEANATKTNFLANMSHELRTPLNAVIGFAEFIQSETFGPAGSPKYIEYAGDIRDAGTHLLSIINDILDLSKIETGKVDLKVAPVAVDESIDSCVQLLRERAKEGDVSVSVDVEEATPRLMCDERMLKQILINLISNAIKFTPPGGDIQIKIWSRPHTGCVFQISDTGIGIEAADIRKALSPFEQVDSDLNRNYEGTGLGLPLSKSLVELHGGSLDLQSELEVGTTVTVRFPASRICKESAAA